jgi:hypothetical protein
MKCPQIKPEKNREPKKMPANQVGKNQQLGDVGEKAAREI